MNDFEILSPDGEDIFLTADVPDKYLKLLLKGATPFMAKCSFGDLLFNHYSGDGFDIWKSNYMIERDARVIGRANVPLLEFSVIYENSFSIDWKGVTNANLPCRQIELYYAPYMDAVTSFDGGRQFTTVDFHFHKDMLDLYSKDFKLLGNFMDKVHRNEPAKLFDGQQFSSPAIDRVIKEMINYKFHDELAPGYYDSYTHILLILLLERISGFNPLAQHYSVSDIEKAHEAKRLLTFNYTESYTIKELCHRLQTNPYKLKRSFQYLFGTSIGKYKKSILMERAKVLLQSTDVSIDDISIELGYNSQQSFSTAFRNYYKVVPTHFRRRR